MHKRKLKKGFKNLIVTIYLTPLCLAIIILNYISKIVKKNFKTVLIVIFMILLLNSSVKTQQHKNTIYNDFVKEYTQKNESTCEWNFNNYLKSNNLENEYNKVILF